MVDVYLGGFVSVVRDVSFGLYYLRCTTNKSVVSKYWTFTTVSVRRWSVVPSLSYRVTRCLPYGTYISHFWKVLNTYSGDTQIGFVSTVSLPLEFILGSVRFESSRPIGCLGLVPPSSLFLLYTKYPYILLLEKKISKTLLLLLYSQPETPTTFLIKNIQYFVIADGNRSLEFSQWKSQVWPSCELKFYREMFMISLPGVLRDGILSIELGSSLQCLSTFIDTRIETQSSLPLTHTHPTPPQSPIHIHTTTHLFPT